ncbi:iron-sulfur cluster co-chaperone protein HscB-like isoform X2 [Teleopsis dalmanni]|nr:iron-sulfur cluster co-chaperone protein HscB-like isoform X2 [Teleopsis dalmanni]XP_037935639.1 iron-sulfur cluster co-chaperone protein HscB-like isoform X2 [Teleopsis dalmanni]XP_037940215.1 iron-sulfur cluster co-chaperone protein HscB-like isoform X2 [Teleopsis dalmanni]XP_037940217.1 iron-sulfur cluster co-chaperone protein HscB-like isoform X2 [Teleopsis dalmanni]
MRRAAVILQNISKPKNVNELCHKVLCANVRREFSTNYSHRWPNVQVEWAAKETQSKNSAHQVRNYVPSIGEAVGCWNCKKTGERKHYMLCEECGFLQDVDMEINYFDLLNFPKSFEIERQKLTQQFRKLQTLVHPDKFSNKTTREQNNSADWSSLINKAYKTLLTPIDRGQYLLKMQGHEIPQDNSSINKEFLMIMMERNEDVEAANSKQDLQKLYKEIEVDLQNEITKLEKCFGLDDINGAKSVLVEMKYLLSIQNSIKNKLQTLVDE